MVVKKENIKSLGYQALGMFSGLDFGNAKPHVIINDINEMKDEFTVDSLVIALSKHKKKDDQPRNKGIDFIIREARKL